MAGKAVFSLTFTDGFFIIMFATRKKTEMETVRLTKRLSEPEMVGDRC